MADEIHQPCHSSSIAASAESAYDMATQGVGLASILYSRCSTGVYALDYRGGV